MVLVDNDIARMVESNSLIENFDANCLTNIGYDLRTEYFAVNQKEECSATLKPGESVFVASKEAVRLPVDFQNNADVGAAFPFIKLHAVVLFVQKFDKSVSDSIYSQLFHGNLFL